MTKKHIPIIICLICILGLNPTEAQQKSIGQALVDSIETKEGVTCQDVFDIVLPNLDILEEENDVVPLSSLYLYLGTCYYTEDIVKNDLYITKALDLLDHPQLALHENYGIALNNSATREIKCSRMLIPL